MWPPAGAHCAPLRITTDLQKRDYLGPPPKPSGDRRGFGGESRSSGMSELSPQAEARDVELATTKGAASRTHRTFPLGGRWPGGLDEGATDRFVLGGHTGPPLRTKTTVIFVGAVFDRPPNKKPGPPGGRPWRYRI